MLSYQNYIAWMITSRVQMLSGHCTSQKMLASLCSHFIGSHTCSRKIGKDSIGTGPLMLVPKYRKKPSCPCPWALGKDPIRADPWVPGCQMLGKTLVGAGPCACHQKGHGHGWPFLEGGQELWKAPTKAGSLPLVATSLKTSSPDFSGSALVAWWKQCLRDTRANCWPPHS